MAYRVKEIFLTLQGEGGQAGRAAVFCRFSGCNLWSGREEDRESAICSFCDTDFVGTDGANGGVFESAEDLAARIDTFWKREGTPLVVFTGGEPLLQLDDELIGALKERKFDIAVESNGSLAAPTGIDWLTVSPKAGAKLVQRSGTELKLVYPQRLNPEDLEQLEFELFYLSPLWANDEATRKRNIDATIDYVRAHPKWRLTLQYHKIWGIP